MPLLVLTAHWRLKWLKCRQKKEPAQEVSQLLRLRELDLCSLTLAQSMGWVCLTLCEASLPWYKRRYNSFKNPDSSSHSRFQGKELAAQKTAAVSYYDRHKYFSLPSGVWPHEYVQHRHPPPYRRRHITHNAAESGLLLDHYWPLSDLQILVLPPFSYVSGPLGAPGTSDDANVASWQ